MVLTIIRYRTRDLTRLLPGTARSMRRIEKITGRSDDMIILRGVNIFPTQIEEYILKCSGLAPHFQIELTRQGVMDQMAVHCEPVPGGSAEGLAKALAKQIRDVVGISAEIRVAEEGGVDRSQGKARRGTVDVKGEDLSLDKEPGFSGSAVERGEIEDLLKAHNDGAHAPKLLGNPLDLLLGLLFVVDAMPVENNAGTDEVEEVEAGNSDTHCSEA